MNNLTNLIIVESNNDKFFIERLIKHCNIAIDDVQVNAICEFECLGGISNLERKLKDLKYDKYKNIGIILDADNEGIKNRIDFINASINKTTNDVTLTEINKLEKSKILDVNFACYIMNHQGYGELETVLKEIKNHSSGYSDCLNSWRDCLDKNNLDIKNKDFDKFYIQTYIRFDTCDKEEKKQAYKNCNFEAAIKKDIWDLDSTILDDLKHFLNIIIS